jgi:hypothetical protein
MAARAVRPEESSIPQEEGSTARLRATSSTQTPLVGPRAPWQDAQGRWRSRGLEKLRAAIKADGLYQVALRVGYSSSRLSEIADNTYEKIAYPKYEQMRALNRVYGIPWEDWGDGEL